MNNRCRCPDAVAANSAYRGARRAGHGTAVFVPAIGATRRLQALATAGYSPAELAARSGLRLKLLWEVRRGRHVSIAASTHERIAALCADLWQHPCTEGPSATTTRSLAAARDWAPFAAWDDIDDPDEVPQHHAQPIGPEPLDSILIERALSGTPVPDASKALRVEIIRQLAGKGRSDTEIGRVLAVSAALVFKLRKECSIPAGPTQAARTPYTAGVTAA